MNHTKCPHCGLINFATDEICQRCGEPLTFTVVFLLNQFAMPANLAIRRMRWPYAVLAVSTGDREKSRYV